MEKPFLVASENNGGSDIGECSYLSVWRANMLELPSAPLDHIYYDSVKLAGFSQGRGVKISTYGQIIRKKFGAPSLWSLIETVVNNVARSPAFARTSQPLEL